MSASPSVMQLRACLRNATAAVHARLDARMASGFANQHDYATYLRGMQALVASLMPAVQPQARAMEWALPQWQQALEQDMQALNVSAIASRPVPVHGRDAALGALYVLEGSTLGARLRVRRARLLGHDAAHGAVFLHAHAEGEDGQRWPRFLRLLERLGPDIEQEVACTAAVDAFHLAERCFQAAGDPR